MINRIIPTILINLKNIPGWKTGRKIVVIESDDWGSIGMPSLTTYNLLDSYGLPVRKRLWNRIDTLETRDDLERLFEVLSGVRDSEKRPSVMSAFTNVANPDFHKIKTQEFTSYHFEKFTETLERYYPGDNVFKVWNEGIMNGIFIPELHGREHFSTHLWMEKLREGNTHLRRAFDNGFVSLDIPGLPGPARGFRAEFFFTNNGHKTFLFQSIIDSVNLFREIFGRLPYSFVPPNGVFHPEFEKVLSGTGVKFLYYIYTVNTKSVTGIKGNGKFVAGRYGPGGLRLYKRNCAFNPVDEVYKDIGLTMKQIAAAFRWNKPAVISTHRVNFAGGLDQANRDKGLTELNKLLRAIMKTWPETIFMSSGEANELMAKSNQA